MHRKIFTFMVLIITGIIFSTLSSVRAEEYKTHYPHGSPFPPGGEPSLTHTVKAFWITTGTVDRTVITVKAPGGMPSMVEGRVPDVKQNKDKFTNPVYAIIAPDCNYKFVFVRKDNEEEFENARVFRSNGMGTVIVKIHGFDSEDYEVLPEVKANYYRGKFLLGTTTIKVHPVSDKIKKKEKQEDNK